MGENSGFKLVSFKLFAFLIPSIFASIEFYDHNYFEGELLHRGDIITTSCETLPWYSWNKAASIKTSTCVNLYSHPHCEGRNFRLEAGDSETLPHFYDDTDSYKACDDVSANSYLKDVRAKFYDDNYFGRLMWDTPIFTGCKNLPSDIWNKAASIKTEVCIVLFSHPDCVGSQFRLEKGDTETLPSFYDDTDSFRPCDDNDVINGFKLKAKIVKFEIWSEPIEVYFLAKNGTIEMAQQTCFWNNGNSKITQQYAVSKATLERVELEKTTSFSTMHTISVSRTVGFETSGGIPSLASTKVSSSLTAGYEFMSQNGGSSSERFVDETTKTFTITQNIEVPACTFYKVNSYVKTTENYPVHYTVFAEVTGSFENGGRLTAEEVKEKLTGLKYKSVKDEHTIIATSDSRLTVSYGFDTSIVGNGKLIENCSHARARGLLSRSDQVDITSEC